MNEKTTRDGAETRKRIKEFIIAYITEHQYPPTIREICKGVQLASTASVNNHIKKMLISGELETDTEGAGASRAIRVPGYRITKIKRKKKKV